MPVLPVNEQSFESEVLASEVPVLLEFGAAWCGPCKMVAPELEALAHELHGQAKVVSIDIDRSPLLAQQFRIQSVPTFVVMHEGQPVAAKTGALRRAQLRELLDPVLPRAVGALAPNEAAQLIQAGTATPVDTREASAFKRAHLPRAVHIPLEEVVVRLSQLHRLGQLPILYCRAGDQTKELAAKLTDQGMPVAFVEGGILGWESSSLPIEREE